MDGGYQYIFFPGEHVVPSLNKGGYIGELSASELCGKPIYFHSTFVTEQEINGQNIMVAKYDGDVYLLPCTLTALGILNEEGPQYETYDAYMGQVANQFTLTIVIVGDRALVLTDYEDYFGP